MIILSTEKNGYTLAELQIKEANLTNSEQFKSELNALIDEGKRNYLVDFSQVEYVDSSFLGALVSCLKYAMSKNADLGVTNLNQDITNLFQLIRMDKVFKIYTGLPESL